MLMILDSRNPKVGNVRTKLVVCDDIQSSNLKRFTPRDKTYVLKQLLTFM